MGGGWGARGREWGRGGGKGEGVGEWVGDGVGSRIRRGGELGEQGRFVGGET